MEHSRVLHHCLVFLLQFSIKRKEEEEEGMSRIDVV